MEKGGCGGQLVGFGCGLTFFAIGALVLLAKPLALVVFDAIVFQKLRNRVSLSVEPPEVSMLAVSSSVSSKPLDRREPGRFLCGLPNENRSRCVNGFNNVASTQLCGLFGWISIGTLDWSAAIANFASQNRRRMALTRADDVKSCSILEKSAS